MSMLENSVSLKIKYKFKFYCFWNNNNETLYAIPKLIIANCSLQFMECFVNESHIYICSIVLSF